MPDRRPWVIAVAFACGGERARDERGADPAATIETVAVHEVERAAQELVEQGSAEALGVALVDGRGAEWSAGFGVVEPGRPVDAETSFPAGSLAKPVLALAVLAAVDRGQIGLDDPLPTLVPGLRIAPALPGAPAPTVRDVLTHQSGLPAEHASWTIAPGDWRTLPDELRGESAAFVPGRALAYSNVAFALLAVGLERATGTPFDERVREDVFEPLGMTHAAFGAPPAEQLAARPRPGTLVPRLVPAAGLWASPADLGRLCAMLLGRGTLDGRRVLAERSVEEMLQVQNAGSAWDLRTRVGLGLVRTFPRLERFGSIAWQDGDVPGAHAIMILLLDHGVGVAVTGVDVDAAAIEELAIAAMEAFAKARGIEGESAPALEAIAWPPDVDPVGRWQAQDAIVSVAREGDRLRVEPWAALVPDATETGPVWLDAQAPGTWTAGRVVLRFAALPVLGDARMDAILGESGGTRGRLAERILPAPAPPSWRARVGRWSGRSAGASPAEPPAALELRVEGEALVLRYELPWDPQRRHETGLVPVSDRAAVLAGVGRGKGETIHASSGTDGERLSWQGLSFRRDGD